MSLAAERTYPWRDVRTALALLAAGVAVVGALPDVGLLALCRTIGVVLVVAGLLLAAGARGRWSQVDAAMRQGQPLPAQPAGPAGRRCDGAGQLRVPRAGAAGLTKRGVSARRPA